MDKNQATIIGNVTKDPVKGESKYGKWAAFTVATTDRVNGKDYPQYVPCFASNITAEIVAQLQRGDRVVVLGKIKSKQKESGNGGSYTQISVGVQHIEKIERRQREEPTLREGADEEKGYSYSKSIKTAPVEGQWAPQVPDSQKENLDIGDFQA